MPATANALIGDRSCTALSLKMTDQEITHIAEQTTPYAIGVHRRAGAVGLLMLVTVKVCGPAVKQRPGQDSNLRPTVSKTVTLSS